MPRLCLAFLIGSMFVLSGGLVGQDKKEDPKKDDPKAKKDDAKKDDPPAKAKGMLPANWKKIGLSEEQVQTIYKIQGKYSEEIDKLEAKIKELRSTKDKEMKAVLTADQKKKLEDILVGKDK